MRSNSLKDPQMSRGLVALWFNHLKKISFTQMTLPPSASFLYCIRLFSLSMAHSTVPCTITGVIKSHLKEMSNVPKSPPKFLCQNNVNVFISLSFQSGQWSFSYSISMNFAWLTFNFSEKLFILQINKQQQQQKGIQLSQNMSIVVWIKNIVL